MADTDTVMREVIVKYSGDISMIEKNLNAEAEILGEGFAIITLQGNQVPFLYNYKEIEYIEKPKTLALMLNISGGYNQGLRVSCISELHRAYFADAEDGADATETYPLTGEGIIVGIIDSGIDYTHTDFVNSDGTSRILYIWDQTEYGNPPSGFKQGTEYNNYQLNEALQYFSEGNRAYSFEIVRSADTAGHGTAVAGICAGNGRGSGGFEKGAAPEASLIIVKLGYRGFESFARTTEIMRALKYIIDKAEMLKMPVAVNISFGTNNGSHDGNSLFESYINAMSQKWKTVIVTATGNEGDAGHHFSGRISPFQTIDVDFIIAENINSLYLTFWKNFADEYTAELILPNGTSTGEIEASQSFTEKITDNVSVQIYYGQPTHYNENQEIFLLIKTNPASGYAREYGIPQGIWRLRIRSREVTVGNFDIWLPTTEEVGKGAAFARPSVEKTLTLPSTAQNVISVGGYNGLINAEASFSGRGFIRNGMYGKPDLSAPAVDIISTRAGGGYDSFTGTSMAAPFVTGAAALMMQWGIVWGNDPFLYGQRVKALLKKGAVRNVNLTAGYPNSIWGYGTLCLKNSMDYLKYLGGSK